MAYGRYRSARKTTSNRTYSRRRSTTTTSRRRAAPRSRAPEVRIVLEAPGIRMPATKTVLPARRKPF